MTGNEATVTYPQFDNLPIGDLLDHFREGGSGAGDRLWSGTTLSDWVPVNTKAGNGEPLVFTQAGGATGPHRFWRVERLEAAYL